MFISGYGIFVDRHSRLRLLGAVYTKEKNTFESNHLVPKTAQDWFFSSCRDTAEDDEHLIII